MCRSENGNKWCLLLIGMFGITQIQIGGYIGISELFMSLCAPIVYLKNRSLFSRDGINTILALALLWAFGVFLSDLVFNSVLILSFFKGIASPLVTWATIVVIYPFLRRTPCGLRWLVMGLAISFVISVFAFHTGAAGGEKATAESVANYKLFWVNMVSQWVGLPVRGWYLETPLGISIVSTVAVSLFALHSGGRSDFLIAFSATVLIVLGRKHVKTMRWIKKHFFIFVISLMSMGVVAKTVYSSAASSGWMGEKEKRKYEKSQVMQKGGVLGMLMSGRAEFFIGFFAALDRPWTGHSSLPLDFKGYRRNFMLDYGNEETVRLFQKADPNELFLIPAHSHIINAWMTNGVFGLVFWLYVLWLLLMTMRRRMAVYPPWYGYLAMMVPYSVWQILFSPFGQRPVLISLICVCLVLRAMERDSRFLIGGQR